MAEESDPVASVAPYLKRVRIKNYAPLRDATADFKSGLNIIIGPNGSGKTRFLSLTSQLMDPFAVHTVGIGCEVVLKYKKDLKITFQQPTAPDELAPNFREGGNMFLKVHITWGAKERVAEDIFGALMQVDLEDSFPATVLAQHGTPLHRMPLADATASLVYGQSFRVQTDTADDTYFSQNQPLLVSSIFNTLRYSFNRRRRHSKVNSLPISFLVEEVRSEVVRVFTSYLDFLNPYLAQYSPIEQVRLSNTFQVYDNAVQQEILVKGLVLEYSIAGSWLPFSALSDGTKRILYLISQLAMPSISFDSTSSPVSFTLHASSRIIFLEEPELGIHHSQLHKMLQLIREVSRDSQVILTTHAPQVLDMLAKDELDRITVCSLDPEKGTQFYKLSEEKQAQARTYMDEVGFLSDYWRYSYLEETPA